MSVGYQCLLFLVTLSDEWGDLLLTPPVIFLYCCVDTTDPTASPWPCILMRRCPRLMSPAETRSLKAASKATGSSELSTIQRGRNTNHDRVRPQPSFVTRRIHRRDVLFPAVSRNDADGVVEPHTLDVLPRRRMAQIN